MTTPNPHQDTVKLLRKFMTLPETRRTLLLKDFSFNVDFMNRLVKGFIDCDEKYNDLLILSAGLHHQLTQVNNSNSEVSEIHSASVKALDELTSDPEAQEALPMELLTLFDTIKETLSALSNGFETITRLNQIVQDNYFRDVIGDADRSFAPDAREALAFFIAQHSKLTGVEDDSGISDEDLSSALIEWSTRFRAEEQE